MITHDMGAVAEMAERMIVMYAGRKAEAGPVQQVIDHPHHPYTKGLISCVPHLLAELTAERPQLTEVEGIVPSLKDFGRNECLFASRCERADEKCRSQRPPGSRICQRATRCMLASRGSVMTNDATAPLLKVENMSVRFAVKGPWRVWREGIPLCGRRCILRCASRRNPRHRRRKRFWKNHHGACDCTPDRSL